MVSAEMTGLRKNIRNTIAVQRGESIASEGKGDYMYVEGRVLTTDGEPIPDAIIETWEADRNGKYRRISCLFLQ
jgi:protocatechuate 3,4-dioxygenase beta subunit